MCCFSAALGLWDIVPIFSIQRGQPDLLMTAIKSRDDICRGALNCLLRCKDLISVLEEDKSFLFNFIMSNCEKFDLKLLRVSKYYFFRINNFYFSYIFLLRRFYYPICP